MPVPLQSQSTSSDHAFVEAVGRRLAEVLDVHLQRAETISASARPMVESIARLSAGGKRMRALLCWWGWQGAGGGPDHPGILDAAVALELFQAAALIHDDVVDRSDTRRGAPSVHRAFESLHRRSGWRQDPAHFGVAAAILTGDLCLALSEELFAEAAESVGTGPAARDRFNTMRFEVMVGQYLDVLDEVEIPAQDPQVALDRARTVLRFKSAHYSTVHPLALGGILAGAEPALLGAYDAFSLPLGEAFQLQDDLLGVFGDPEVTGKPAGDDLREGKRTELVAHAMELLSPDEGAELDARLGDPQLSADQVARLQELLEHSGARARVEAEVSDLGGQAVAALSELQVPATVHEGLSDLAQRILSRRH
ncbi:polyprenyl synthetase family protein [Micrococcus terreus]|uniref:polyprenyl synthetase family protein n=1 Tax=Micrococcus terreus TaxID=574650 RepID=UPI0021A6473B|nr:polyprenyl synthetase family protein [Micrococcus terreus]MCT2089049.1 polyprenyl synthetase family protein [Micrococcus terreus]